MQRNMTSGQKVSKGNMQMKTGSSIGTEEATCHLTDWV